MDPAVDPAASPPAVDPAVAAAADLTANPLVADPQLPLEPAAPAASVAEGEKTVPLRVMLDRISRETRKREETERASADTIATLQARLREAEARGGPNGQTAAPHAAPAPTTGQADIDAAVERRADAKVLNNTINDIVKAGYDAFGSQKFDQDCNILKAVDCVNDAFLLDVIAVDRSNAHKMLAKLAADPENAGRLALLDSRSRIAELTRMSMVSTPAAAAAATPLAPAVPATPPAAPAAPARAVSRAPAPPPPVEPSASKVVDWRSDDASDAQFDEGFKDMMKNRHGLRR